jgi:RHS repeat-associated protein
MNQLVGVKQVTATGTQLSVSYSYDVLGKRVEDDTWKPGTGTVTVRHAYDGMNIWSDVTATNTLLARYVYGDSVDQVWARAIPAGLTNAGVAWYLTDRQGSVRDIMNSSSVIVDHSDYDGFGNATHTTITVADQFGYAGGLYSYDTKMEQFGARWYDAATGRWVSEDPSGFDGGDLNLGRYCGNNPTNNLDPSGLAYLNYVVRGVKIRSTGDLSVDKTMDLALNGDPDNKVAFPAGIGVFFLTSPQLAYKMTFKVEMDVQIKYYKKVGGVWVEDTGFLHLGYGDAEKKAKEVKIEALKISDTVWQGIVPDGHVGRFRKAAPDSIAGNKNPIVIDPSYFPVRTFRFFCEDRKVEVSVVPGKGTITVYEADYELPKRKK